MKNNKLEQSVFQYDVFISYRQRDPDKRWVRDYLVPALEKKGLRVFIDYRDFRLGSPLVVEMAKAVEGSRYTLAVLTPAYLESNFTDLETILADQIGLEIGSRKLIAVMRESCKPRLGIRAKLWLDMTSDDDFESQINRLVSELEQSL